MTEKLRGEIPANMAPENACVTRVMLGAPAHDYRGFASLSLGGDGWGQSVSIPCDRDFFNDLLTVLGADDLVTCKGSACRVLYDTLYNMKMIRGIAHIIESKVLIIADYERKAVAQAKPKEKPISESELFMMSTVEPPPGAPWKIIDDGEGMFFLKDAEGAPLAATIHPNLVKWLVDEAKIAVLHRRQSS